MGLPGGYAYPPGDMHISQETHRSQSTPAGPGERQAEQPWSLVAV